MASPIGFKARGQVLQHVAALLPAGGHHLGLARFGPTTPKLGTRAGVRLAAIGKGDRIASLPGRIP